MKSALTTIDEDPKLNFWRLIHGGFLDLAVLEWCKVFGSNAEPTHWKGVVEDRVAFTEALLNSVGLNRDEWDSYWNHLKKKGDGGVKNPPRGVMRDI
ncbi:hypothetical protein [Litorivivens sp.]|uniref:hypothetical protein n=1 Tax=Litorivivens sp. TaxID=2020868 RepID=UPI0035652404